MVKERAGQEFLLTTIIFFEHYIILVVVQLSCCVQLFALNNIILVQLWVGG